MTHVKSSIFTTEGLSTARLLRLADAYLLILPLGPCIDRSVWFWSSALGIGISSTELCFANFASGNVAAWGV